MSEPFLERLSRFTPETRGLNRDAVLFAAGRASARPNRVWVGLASLLAGTQALSLVLLLQHPNPDRNPNLPAGRWAGPVAAAPVPPPAPAARTPDPVRDPGLWSARHSLLESESLDHPAADVTFIDSEPPLRAFPTPPSLLN
jgi:hypothetical protein